MIKPICLGYPCIEGITTSSAGGAVEEEALAMKLKDFLPKLFSESMVVENPIKNRIGPERVTRWLMTGHCLQ